MIGATTPNTTPKPQARAVESNETKVNPTLYLPALSADIINLLDERERLTTADIQKHTQANIHTIKKHVKELVDWGLMQKHGTTKGAWYTKPLR